MTSRSAIRPETNQAIARRLKALRKTTGLSQQAFAEKYGLSYKQWGNFEAGSRPGLDAALTLVRELRVTLDWIYLGETGMMPHSLVKIIEDYERQNEVKQTA